MRISHLAILALFLLVGCRNGSSSGDTTFFELSLKVKVCEKDDFQLFYLITNADSYSDERSLRIPVSPSESFQKIAFQLPTKNYPPSFRLDLGEYGQTCMLQIDTVQVKFRNKRIVIPPEALSRYFDLNIYTELENSFLRRFPVEGRYDPILYSSPLLEKEMYLTFQLAH